MTEPRELIEKSGREGQIFMDIHMERIRQDRLHPDFPDLNDTRYLILAEEVGEVAKDSLECNYPNLRKELIEVAAVAVRWVDALDRDGMV